MSRIHGIIARPVGAMLLLLAGGCEMAPNSRPEPVVVSRGPSYSYFDAGGGDPDRSVVLIDRLENPGRSVVRWRNVGEGMADVLGKALRAQGRFDAWVSSRAGRDVRRALDLQPSARRERFALMRSENPNLAYVVVGRVTDFQIITESARDKNGESFQVDQSALVAIDYTIISIESGRIVMSDHILGEVSANPAGDARSYRNMAFGSIQFWGTPLGRATQAAVDRVVGDFHRLPEVAFAASLATAPQDSDSAGISDAVAESSRDDAFARNGGLSPSEPEFVSEILPREARVPAPVVEGLFDPTRLIRIERQLEARRVRVIPGSHRVVHEGEMFFVGRYDAARGRMVSIDDPDTGRPLRAKVVDVGRNSALAMLLGIKPPGTSLRGAILSKSRLPSLGSAPIGAGEAITVAGLADSP